MEASMIFKVEKRRSRQNGKLHLTRCYYLRYRVGDMPVDRWKSLGATDLQVANKRAQEFIQEREREAAGILEPKLVRDAAQRALVEHLDDYEADLVKRGRAGRGGRGARLLKSRILRLLNDCGWKLAGSITADSFIAWRNRQTDSARTLNHYLQGMISFLNWMERGGRIKFNPLKNVFKVDGRGQKKRVRRALTDDELRKLVQSSGSRGIIYFTAARTGLRWEELRQLTWGDVRLEASQPEILVRAETAKNKTEEPVMLVPEIVEALQAYRPARCSANDLVFPNGIPRARRLQKDAEALGIAYQDEAGRFADFHALRYTWATFLQRNGVAQRFAMKLMRHSDIKLTAKVYTDETKLPIYDSIKNLPRLGNYTQIRAQISGAEGQNGAQPVASSERVKPHESLVNGGLCPVLSLPVATTEVERAKGIEPSSQPWEGHILPLNHTRLGDKPALTIIFSRAFPKMQPVYGRHHCAASSRLMASRNFASISFCRSTEMILPPPISRT
jgi:integrase